MSRYLVPLLPGLRGVDRGEEAHPAAVPACVRKVENEPILSMYTYKYLLYLLRWSTTVNYMWLDPEQCCWSTMAAAVYKTQYVFGVSLTKWEAYLLGGKSSQHDQSTR